MLSDEELAAFMNDPRQRQAEVIVAHRIGYWGGENIEGCTPEEIAEADAYLEAHIQSRITEAVRADMQPREVRTVEELDALPEGSIVRDRTGDTFSYRGGLWCSFEAAKFESEWIFRKWSPLTLVFTPSPLPPPTSKEQRRYE